MLHAPPQRPLRANGYFTRYLTKEDVRLRYGWQSKISVDRAWQRYGTLPAPTLFQGRRPLWDAAALDGHDAARKFDASA